MAQHDARRIAADWLARFGDRLNTLPPILQAEVISTVHTKASLAAMDDGRIRWRAHEGVAEKTGKRIASDLELCVKRVLSRARLRKFHVPPDDASEFRRQMAEVAAELDLRSPWDEPQRLAA